MYIQGLLYSIRRLGDVTKRTQTYPRVTIQYSSSWKRYQTQTGISKGYCTVFVVLEMLPNANRHIQGLLYSIRRLGNVTKRKQAYPSVTIQYSSSWRCYQTQTDISKGYCTVFVVLETLPNANRHIQVLLYSIRRLGDVTKRKQAYPRVTVQYSSSWRCYQTQTGISKGYCTVFVVLETLPNAHRHIQGLLYSIRRLGDVTKRKQTYPRVTVHYSSSWRCYQTQTDISKGYCTVFVVLEMLPNANRHIQGLLYSIRRLGDVTKRKQAYPRVTVQYSSSWRCYQTQTGISKGYCTVFVVLETLPNAHRHIQGLLYSIRRLGDVTKRKQTYPRVTVQYSSSWRCYQMHTDISKDYCTVFVVLEMLPNANRHIQGLLYSIRRIGDVTKRKQTYPMVTVQYSSSWVCYQTQTDISNGYCTVFVVMGMLPNAYRHIQGVRYSIRRLGDFTKRIQAYPRVTVQYTSSWRRYQTHTGISTGYCAVYVVLEMMCLRLGIIDRFK